MPLSHDSNQCDNTYKSHLEHFVPQNSLSRILAKKSTQNNFMPSHQKPAIVAGNGVSYLNIDYTRLPFDFCVFRCGQFYFEDKYYLGKDIKAIAINPVPAFISLHTILHIMRNNEYNIDKIFMHDCPIFRCKEVDGKYDIARENIMQTIDLLSHFMVFVDRIYDGNFSRNIAEFLEWSKLASIYDLHHITTGIIMCAMAVAMGHKEIYIAGIDFYDDSMGAHYFTNMSSQNMSIHTGLFTTMDASGTRYKEGMKWHKKIADIEGLYFLQEYYGVKFYSLCENSPINELIPLAPKIGNSYNPKPKPQHYTKDIVIPKWDSFALARAQQQQQQQQLKANIYWRAIYGLLRLPSHIKLYVLAKMNKMALKKHHKK